MKKKLFLTCLIAVAFMCILIISVSATAIDKDTTVTLSGDFTVGEEAVTNPVVNLYDDDGDALIWYLNTDGKLVSDKIANLVSVDSDGVISFKDQKIFYGSQSGKSVVVINLRDNVKVSGTEINYDGTIYHFDSSKGEGTDTGLAASGFQFGTYNYSGHQLQYFYFPTTAKSITKRMFQGTPAQVIDIEPGTPIAKIGLLAFYEVRKLTEIYIPNDVEVFTSLIDQGLFQKCISLERVIFEENSMLWDAGCGTFQECSSLKELYLPNSVKTVGHQFARSSGIEVISLGASFEYFTMKYEGADPDNNHMWVFWGCNLKKVYMPATFGLISDAYDFDDLVNQKSGDAWIGDDRLDTFDRAFNSAGNFTLYFTGTKEEIETLKTRIAYTASNESLVNALNKIYSYDEYVASGSPSGSCAVYDYNVCDAFYGGKHDLESADGNTCCGICSRCGLKTLLENPQHTYEKVFNKGEKVSFLSAISVADVCKYCEDTVELEGVGQIITVLGYSFEENGTGITQRTLINRDALLQYAQYAQIDNYDFGVLAGIAEKNASDEYIDGTPLLVDETGSVYAKDKNSLVYALCKDFPYSMLQIKLTGINKTTAVYCCAFLVLGNNVTYISNEFEDTTAKKYDVVI